MDKINYTLESHSTSQCGTTQASSVTTFVKRTEHTDGCSSACRFSVIVFSNESGTGSGFVVTSVPRSVQGDYRVYPNGHLLIPASENVGREDAFEWLVSVNSLSDILLASGEGGQPTPNLWFGVREAILKKVEEGAADKDKHRDLLSRSIEQFFKLGVQDPSRFSSCADRLDRLITFASHRIGPDMCPEALDLIYHLFSADGPYIREIERHLGRGNQIRRFEMARDLRAACLLTRSMVKQRV
jgi:hypothetical protein